MQRAARQRRHRAGDGQSLQELADRLGVGLADLGLGVAGAAAAAARLPSSGPGGAGPGVPPLVPGRRFVGPGAAPASGLLVAGLAFRGRRHRLVRLGRGHRLGELLLDLGVVQLLAVRGRQFRHNATPNAMNASTTATTAVTQTALRPPEICSDACSIVSRVFRRPITYLP
jgi:hypothetical protein